MPNGDTQQEIDARRTEQGLIIVTEIVGIKIRNQQDEMKVKVIARLYKNLNLEQLENLEVTVKNSFKGSKKNYVLELP